MLAVLGFSFTELQKPRLAKSRLSEINASDVKRIQCAAENIEANRKKK